MPFFKCDRCLAVFIQDVKIENSWYFDWNDTEWDHTGCADKGLMGVRGIVQGVQIRG